MNVQPLEDRFGRDLALLTLGWLVAMTLATAALVLAGPLVYGI